VGATSYLYITLKLVRFIGLHYEVQEMYHRLLLAYMRGVPSSSDPGEFFFLDVLSTYTLRTPSSTHAQLCMTHLKLCKVGVKMRT